MPWMVEPWPQAWSSMALDWCMCVWGGSHDEACRTPVIVEWFFARVRPATSLPCGLNWEVSPLRFRAL
eukprot:scaffold63203_cov64-Phaeocystis_antarctica.AAC.4